MMEQLFPAEAGDHGMWRSLVARVVRDDEVAGSNPVIPTNCERPRTVSVRGLSRARTRTSDDGYGPRRTVPARSDSSRPQSRKCMN